MEQWSVAEDSNEYQWLNFRRRMDFENFNISFSDISQKTLQEAAAMVIYLNFCPPKEATFYYNLIMSYPLKEIMAGKGSDQKIP